MVLRLRLSAGINVHDVQVVGHVVVVDVNDGALATLALPRTNLDLVHVRDVERLVNENAFRLQPIFVGVGDAEIRQTG